LTARGDSPPAHAGRSARPHQVGPAAPTPARGPKGRRQPAGLIAGVVACCGVPGVVLGGRVSQPGQGGRSFVSGSADWGPMPTPGRTGLVIPVPAADALLGSVGARYPGTVRAGLPAHVSLLYPFVVAAKLDERVTTALHELFVEQVPIPVDFVACYRRGGFVALHPAPSDHLKELMARIWRRWPDVVPYEGAYADLEPHVTIAMRCSEQLAVRIEQEVTAELPIRAELREAWLLAYGGQWILRNRFEFCDSAAS
jgi:2'-5' RNA ligase superfamily